MIWTTCTYTLTTTNSLSVKRQMNSVRMFKGLYGKNLKNTTMKISYAQEPQKNHKEEIHDSQRKDSKRWSDVGEKNGGNQLYNRMKILAYEEFCHRETSHKRMDIVHGGVVEICVLSGVMCTLVRVGRWNLFLREVRTRRLWRMCRRTRTPPRSRT